MFILGDFFRNFAIEVTAGATTPHEYSKLQGYIWKSSIIDRDFYETDYTGCDADRFIEIISGEKKDSLMQIIGYSISKYKDALNPRAVVIIEDVDPETEGEAQGGSGKGLLFQFVAQYRKHAFIDGQTFHADAPFAFHSIDVDTSIVLLDDVNKNFKFTSLFSALTESLVVNKKNLKQFVLPFNRSPKFFITSNYSIGGLDASSMRRKYEFAIIKYFGVTITPIDMFGRQFFFGWDRTEWLRFDNFIVDCCRKYLAEINKRAIGNITIQSAERALVANTNKDFIDYMDQQLSVNFFDFAPAVLKTKTIKYPDGSITSNGVDVQAYLANKANPEYYLTMGKELFYEKIIKLCHLRHITTTKLTQWIKAWAGARKIEIDTSYKRNNDSERMYRIVPSFENNKSEMDQNDSKSGNDLGKTWESNSLWD